MRKMMGFKSFQTAEETLAGIEAFHMLRKKQVEITPASSDVEWINILIGMMRGARRRNIASRAKRQPQFNPPPNPVNDNDSRSYPILLCLVVSVA
jgi:hypothetical protein